MRVLALEEFMNRLYKVLFLAKLLGLCFWWVILRSYVTLDLCDSKEKNCLPFGYSNNQFERPLTFKSSHTCKFCFYAVVELRGGYTYYAFYWLQLPHIS